MEAITEAAGTKGPHALDVRALDAWIGEHIPGLGHVQDVEKFPGGQSNPTYRLRTSAGRYVMRAKPAPLKQLLPSAHAIEREYRIMKALAGTDVPVPRTYGLCEDESVIGRAFFVMEHAEGRILWDQALPGQAPGERAAIYEEMGRVIALLHGTDYQAVGLTDFGRPTGYLTRQIRRWTQQYRDSESQPVESMERLLEWLPRHVPPDEEAAIVHGDFRLDNMVFAADQARVVAILDWELATIGHPLADFAYHCLSWHLSPQRFRGIAGLDLENLGIPAEHEHLQHYCRCTGRDLGEVRTHWDFFLAFSLFRLAAIAQGVAHRSRQGVASNADAGASAALVEPLAQAGWAAAQRAR